jgi:rod shape-determining protein MreD
MKYFLFYAITLLGGLWLQVIQNHFLGGSLFSVQFLVVAAIYWGLAHGPLSGSVIGFLWGLLSDAASLGLLGERALLFAAVGFSAGFFRRQLDDTKPWTQGIFTLFASLAVVIGELLIEHFFSGTAQRPVSLSVWLQPFWNALAAPLLFLAFQSWDMVWDVREGNF